MFLVGLDLIRLKSKGIESEAVVRLVLLRNNIVDLSRNAKLIIFAPYHR